MSKSTTSTTHSSPGSVSAVSRRFMRRLLKKSPQSEARVTDETEGLRPTAAETRLRELAQTSMKEKHEGWTEPEKARLERKRRQRLDRLAQWGIESTTLTGESIFIGREPDETLTSENAAVAHDSKSKMRPESIETPTQRSSPGLFGTSYYSSQSRSRQNTGNSMISSASAINASPAPTHGPKTSLVRSRSGTWSGTRPTTSELGKRLGKGPIPAARPRRTRSSLIWGG